MKSIGKFIGIIIRGVGLGFFLFLAIMVLISKNADTLIFRYQGF